MTEDRGTSEHGKLTFRPGDLVTVADVALILRVTPDTVRRYLVTGQLKGTKLGSAPNSPLRITFTSLRDFIMAHTQPGMGIKELPDRVTSTNGHG